MRNEGRKINHVEVPVPGPPAGWTPPPEPTPEKLREDALVHLSRIESRRATESLIRDGWDDVIWLRNHSYISREEFGELKSITDAMPRRADVF